jgi:predicted lipid-binding transport protein (Tim44 family)
MKQFWKLLMVLLVCMSLLSGVAEAKRLGGGSSFGKNRPAPAKQMQRAPEAAPQPAPAAAPQNGMSKWMGPLAGLAIGAGLATLFSHGGLGNFANNFGTLLMVVAGFALLMFLVRRFQNTQASPPQYAGAGAPYAPAAFQSGSASQTSAAAPTYANIPADFPVDSFLRGAKASFIRLQAANDRKDINDIREYTTPEVYAEISLQLHERGDATQTTEVLNIEAALIEVVTEGAYTIASVRYSGQLRENNGAIETIDEIWHLQKALQPSDAPWLLAGIQQV